MRQPALSGKAAMEKLFLIVEGESFSTRSARSSLAHLKWVRRHLAGLHPEQLPREGYRRILADSRPERVSAETVNGRIRILRKLIRAALDCNIITPDIVDWSAIKGLRPAPGRDRFLTVEEVEKIAKESGSPDSEALILLAAFTGLRIGELVYVARTPSCVRRTRMGGRYRYLFYVPAKQAKSRKARTVPVPQRVEHLLELLPTHRTTAWLRRRFLHAARRLGIEDVRFHDLRHTYASWMASTGKVQLTDLRDLLGHADLKVTSRYAHLFTSRLFEAASVLEDVR